ncbi:MAG: glycosyltransferase [Bacteroidota bacterium]
MEFKNYRTSAGETLLYTGNPDLQLMDTLAQGVGDVWHSSFEQGFKNAFSNIQYQTHIAWWYTNDFDTLDECLSWRINPYQFVIRKNVWDLFKGFDNTYQSSEMKALSLGYDLIRNGGIPLYVKGLFADTTQQYQTIPAVDEYVFFRKKFKPGHSLYLWIRKGIWNLSETRAFLYAKKNATFDYHTPVIAPKVLSAIHGDPSVSYIIPTMMRQDYTLQLLNDLNRQTYTPTQVIVVDATPADQREESLYNTSNYDFELIVKWQTSKGSCRARNEGIELSTGDFIIFGDDDIRIAPDYIENHIRLLQTYRAGACNGLDIRADHPQQNQEDLAAKRGKHSTTKIGVSAGFNNANSCVRKEHVQKLTGNDVNYDGGYGEDSDFGLSLVKSGVVVLYNPYAVNLHLKPASGGYRWWGAQAKLLGKKRKQQPWELDTPVKWIRPVPSPTIMYYIHKHFKPGQIAEYKIKYFMHYLGRGSKLKLPLRILNIPYKLLQYRKSVWYAQKLISLGLRYK